MRIELITLLDYINLVALAIVVFSVFNMLHFLRKREIEKSWLYTFNPLFFINYMKITKNETGKYGLWFKVCVVSFLATIISGIALTVLN